MAPETPWLALQNAVAKLMVHLHHFPFGYEGHPVMYCREDGCFKIAMKHNENDTFCDQHAPGGAVELSYAAAYRGVLKMLELAGGCSFGNDQPCKGASEEAVVQRYKDFSEGKGVCPVIVQRCEPAVPNLAFTNPRAAFMIAHHRSMTEEEADALLTPEALAILQTPLPDEE